MNAFTQTITHDVVEFKTLSPQVRFLLAIQIIILFILSILIGIIFSPKFKKSVTEQPIGTSPIQIEQEQTTLQLMPTRDTMNIGDQQTVSVNILDTAPTAVDIVLLFDPEVFEVTNVINTGLFDRELINSVEDGSILFSAAHSPGEKTGTGAVFTFTITALTNTERAIINFSKEKTIVAHGGKNILGNTRAAIVHINE